MRSKLLLLAAATIIALAACGEREQDAGNGLVAEEGFTVENSVGNDLTAIDAATADDARMAADVAPPEEGNLGNEVVPGNETALGNGAADDER